MTKIWEQIEPLLPDVQKPVRYINTEINSATKNWNMANLKICLAYPDTYEVGMSNQGLQILYSILNSQADILAERVYNPWIDFEKKLVENKIPLFSLESNHYIKDFDLFGITIQHELTYTNILRLLNLAGIPLLSKERSDSFPLILGGGPGAFNPEPLAQFFDFFVIGDGEEVILEITDLIKDAQSTGLERIKILNKLSGINGIYVPGFFDVTYEKNGTIKEIKNNGSGPERIVKRTIPNIDNRLPAETVIIPYMDIVHERASIEIMRGCTRGCRFCQAGIIYRPVREKNIHIAFQETIDLAANSGQDQIGLSALSCSDYTRIKDLVDSIIKETKKQAISVSLPSLRVDTFSVRLASQIQQVKKTGLTFAPEAGSQRLRNVINKQIGEDDIYQAARAAFQSGWFKLKLYFMIGLPTETYEDLDGIIKIVNEIVQIGRNTLNSGVRKRLTINVSLSNFIPKPQTPFQWSGMDNRELLEEKQKYIKDRLRVREVKIRWHDAKQSLIEAILARGDRRLADLLLKANELGISFDNWTEQFDYTLWQMAIQESAVDPAFYLEREREKDEILPWDHLDSGVDKDFLYSEYNKSKKGLLSPDCRFDVCLDCGLCDKKIKNLLNQNNDKI